MVPRHQLFACVIRQYGTGLYRAWVSLGRNKAICLGTHQNEANATETIERFLETYQEGQIETLEDILTYLNSSCVQDQMAPLPLIGQSVAETERYQSLPANIRTPITMKAIAAARFTHSSGM